jgi:hypothetical protein
MKKGEIVFFGVCVAFFGFMFFEAMGLAGRGRAGEMGSGFWPAIAIGVSTLLSILLLAASVKKFRQGLESSKDQTAEAIAERRRQSTTVTLSVVCFLVYMVLVPWIGFILSTLLFIPGFSLALGERRKWVLFIAPFLLTAIIIAVFAKFITIPFPKGVGIFAEFSRLFY